MAKETFKCSTIQWLSIQLIISANIFISVSKIQTILRYTCINKCTDTFYRSTVNNTQSFGCCACTCTIGFSVVVFIWLFFSISLEHLYFCVFKSTSPNDVCVCVVLCGKKWNKFKLNYRFICWSSIIFVLWPPLTWPSSRVAVLHSEFIPKGAVAYNRYTLTSSKHSTRPL